MALFCSSRVQPVQSTLPIKWQKGSQPRITHLAPLRPTEDRLHSAHCVELSPQPASQTHFLPEGTRGRKTPAHSNEPSLHRPGQNQVRTVQRWKGSSNINQRALFSPTLLTALNQTGRSIKTCRCPEVQIRRAADLCRTHTSARSVHHPGEPELVVKAAPRAARDHAQGAAHQRCWNLQLQ